MPSIRQPQFSRALQEQGFRRQLRRLADVLIACVLLAITSPLMITVALAIKLESAGPVLERQERIGRDGRRIDYSYDAANRQTAQTWKDSGGSTVNTFTLTYDAGSNLLTAANNSGRYTIVACSKRRACGLEAGAVAGS